MSLKIHSKIILLVICLLSSVHSSSCSSDARELYEEINIPIYPQGYSVAKGIDHAKTRKYVAYKINVNFPALEVIEFYNTKFKELGLKFYSDDGYGTRQWDNFNHSTGRWEKTDIIPARFIATWTDAKKEKRVVLYLAYEYRYNDNKDSWQNVLLVSCDIYPFFDFRDHNSTNIVDH
jgi:hypothetical protein